MILAAADDLPDQPGGAQGSGRLSGAACFPFIASSQLLKLKSEEPFNTTTKIAKYFKKSRLQLPMGAKTAPTNAQRRRDKRKTPPAASGQ
jgi:hypothetical protein